MKKNHLTPEGLEKLKTELANLVNKKKPDAIKRLQKARSMGDLSENSEYTAAKENLEFIENRISELETIIKNSSVIKKNSNKTFVEIGDSVTIVNQENNKNHTYTIVGEYEANPLEGKISVSSPIGKGLLGKKIGDKVEIKTPSGKIIFLITKID